MCVSMPTCTYHMFSGESTNNLRKSCNSNCDVLLEKANEYFNGVLSNILRKSMEGYFNSITFLEFNKI